MPPPTLLLLPSLFSQMATLGLIQHMHICALSNIEELIHNGNVLKNGRH